MQGDQKIIRLTHLWYSTNEVAALLEVSRSVFERVIKPHRETLGEKMVKKWSNIQVKKIFSILVPHVCIIIE